MSARPTVAEILDEIERRARVLRVLMEMDRPHGGPGGRRVSARISVRRDAELDAALAVLASAGWSVSEAVRYAVQLLADSHTGAYDAGLAPAWESVDVVACTVQPRLVPASYAA